MNIEQMIRKNADSWGVVSSEYIIRVQSDKDGVLKVYVRPSGRNGDTVDYIITDNTFIPVE